MMLSINNLRASVGGKQILNGVNLHVKAGEVHVIMGPNGSGKTTLANVLGGREGIDVEGEVLFEGHDLKSMSPEERAVAGVFIAFQNPVEIPGVGNIYFLRTALNAIRRARGADEIDAIDFLALVEERMRFVEMDKGFMTRAVNDGFSGGEKKRNEILQMAILEPKLAILDETDSGLDIDALRVVARGVNALRRDDRATIVITHYPRILEQIIPDRVHVMTNGRIVASGDKDLAVDLEKRGYADFGSEPTALMFGAEPGLSATPRRAEARDHE